MLFRSVTCYFQQYQALAPCTLAVHSEIQGRNNSVKELCCEEDNLATKWSLSGYSQLPTTSLTYLFAYLLTAWSRVLLEKQTGLQLVKKFLAFYGTRKFITVFISARHLSLS
jgi:hypothetical protein